jgi:hypothetical protein
MEPEGQVLLVLHIQEALVVEAVDITRMLEELKMVSQL